MNINIAKLIGMFLITLGVIGLIITVPLIPLGVGFLLFFKDDIRLKLNKWLSKSSK